jgi:hypothetical protein
VGRGRLCGHDRLLPAHARCSRAYVRRTSGRTYKLRRLPALFDAWRDGSISKYQVEVVLANIGRHMDLFASQETEFVPSLVPLSPAETVAVMVEWRRRADAIDEGEDKLESASKLYLATTMHGRRELSGHLSAEEGQIVAAAIDAARSRGGEGTEIVGAAAQRADALVGICRHYLAQHGPDLPGRTSAQVAVLVRYEDMAAGGPGRAGRRHGAKGPPGDNLRGRRPKRTAARCERPRDRASCPAAGPKRRRSAARQM